MNKIAVSTWPSADLWKRMAENTLLDDTPCPACRCPAATHRRDVDTQAFLCPPGGDPVKLLEMVRRAPPAPNAAFVGAQPNYENLRRQREMAARDIEMLLTANPNLREYADEIRRIGAQNPALPMADVVAIARQRVIVQNEMRASRLDAAVDTARELTGTVGIDAGASYYNQNGIAPSRVARERATTKSAPPARKPKRRFNLNDED